MQENEGNIVYHITPEQAEIIKDYWDYAEADDYEVCQLLDKTIDTLLVSLLSPSLASKYKKK